VGTPLPPVREDVTLETIEAEEAAAKAAGEKPDLSKVTLGDNVPEELKGKTVIEALDLLKGMGASLKLSEDRRQQLERELQQRAAAPAQPATPVEPEVKKLTKDELADLFQKQPIEAIEYMQAEAEERVQRNVAARLNPLISGSASAGEAAARAKFPDEFVLFGDQMTQFVANIRDKTQMAQPNAWDDLVAYFRGLPANFDKLVEHRAGKKKQESAATAQAAEAAAAGPVIRSQGTSVTGGGAKGADGLDDTERQIANELDMSPVEYNKWKRAN
jgi:hypothetical protein